LVAASVQASTGSACRITGKDDQRKPSRRRFESDLKGKRKFHGCRRELLLQPAFGVNIAGEDAYDELKRENMA
jgi:hypothetical protein